MEEINKNIKVYKNKVKNRTLMVSFCGTDQSYTFVNYLKPYDNFDKIFIIEGHGNWYHSGIGTITTDIESTCSYLNKYIENYDKVIFIGISMGGYGAILFGSMLKVTKVISFMPQTDLTFFSDSRKKNLDSRFIMLDTVINDFTIYNLFCLEITNSFTETKDRPTNFDAYHHGHHGQLIELNSNVYVHYKYRIDMKTWRNNGTLNKIFNELIIDFKSK